MFVDGPVAGSHQVIPGTAPGSCMDPTCVPGTCKRDLVGSPLALTVTSDGAFWLAYAVDHLDTSYTRTCDSKAQTCHETPTATRLGQPLRRLK